MFIDPRFVSGEEYQPIQIRDCEITECINDVTRKRYYKRTRKPTRQPPNRFKKRSKARR